MMLKLPLIILGLLFVATLVAAALVQPDDEARAAAARRRAASADSPLPSAPSFVVAALIGLAFLLLAFGTCVAAVGSYE